MQHPAIRLILALAAGGWLLAQEDPGFVFKSEVALVRVDVQVVDRANRPIANLNKEDFVLLHGGQQQEIKNFAREEMPVDVLLLLDVSGSMRPHVQRVADAAEEAMQALGPQDRVGIMVFDRATRVRMPFRANRQSIYEGLANVLRDETFDGGTDITRGLLDAARFIGKEGRKEARHAIVILTDDQTERDRDEAGVARALAASDSILSALIAPDAYGSGRPGVYGGGGGRSGGGMGWPNDPLGGIIFGRRGPYGGGGGPQISMPRTRSAGTSEIARASGGDSMRVDDARALETTLERLRQRYALHYSLPEGVGASSAGDVQVMLADGARRRYADSRVRYRQGASQGGGSADDPVVSQAPPLRRRNPQQEDDAPTSSGGWRRNDPAVQAGEQDDQPERRASRRRRPAVSERTDSTQPSVITSDEPAATAPAPAAQSGGAWKRTEEPAPASGGWRRAKPGEEKEAQR